MGISSSTMLPQELGEFRKLTSNQEVEIPATPQNRTVTDKKGFVIFGIMFVIFVPFFIYTLVRADIRRLSHGNDNCGNLCGVANAKIDGLDCSGKDYRDKPYQVIKVLENITHCTDLCPPGQVNKQGNCDDPNDGSTIITHETLWKSVSGAWWKFFIIIFITAALCIAMLLLFKYVPQIVVWGMLVSSILFLIIITCLLWYGYSDADPKETYKDGFLALAIFFTIFDIIIIIIVAVLVKKIKLIIVLYKETAKAIFAMPLLILIPVLTITFQLIIFGLLLTSTAWMTSAADLVETSKSNYNYVRNGAMIFAMTINVFMALWAMYFLASCQYMVTAGSVASWFFARNNRLYTNTPIFNSFTNTIRFHLGTVALGSFILMLVAVIKALIQSLLRNSKIRWIVNCCLDNIEAFIKMLSKNAYIETAIHGQSFFRSGKRAAQLLINNASSFIAINSIGNFVLGIMQLLLLGITTGIAYAFFASNSDTWFPTVLSLLINLCIIIVMFDVFVTTVDTLFICFCEDVALNDGTSKPYCMSKNLMQFVESSKKMYNDNK